MRQLVEQRKCVGFTPDNLVLAADTVEALKEQAAAQGVFDIYAPRYAKRTRHDKRAQMHTTRTPLTRHMQHVSLGSHSLIFTQRTLQCISLF